LTNIRYLNLRTTTIDTPWNTADYRGWYCDVWLYAGRTT